MKARISTVLLLALSLGLLAGCATSKRMGNKELTLKPLGPNSGVVLIGNIPTHGRIAPTSFHKAVSGYGFEVWDVALVTIDGVRKLSAEVYNWSSSPRNLQYRIVWYDQLGIEIKMGPEGWYPLHLDGKDTRSITVSSASSRAVSFKLFIRKIK